MTAIVCWISKKYSTGVFLGVLSPQGFSLACRYCAWSGMTVKLGDNDREKSLPFWGARALGSKT